MFKSLFRERSRSAAVRKLTILDTPAEPGLNRFVEAAASAFNAPIALLSLIQDDRQCFRASHGLAIDCIPRDHGFCSFTLDQSNVIESCDPQADERFADLPVVTGDPHIRYYIGVPLRLLSGIDVGALCVLDTIARRPASTDQKAYLVGLARQASMALEARINLWDNAA